MHDEVLNEEEGINVLDEQLHHVLQMMEELEKQILDKHKKTIVQHLYNRKN